MTIDEARIKANELKRAIQGLIDGFERQTNLPVTRLDLRRIGNRSVGATAIVVLEIGWEV